MSMTQSASSAVPVGDLWIALRRRWYLIVVGAIIGGALGWWFGGLSPLYQAQATVEVAPIVTTSESGLDSAGVSIATEQAIATSGTVLSRVVDSLEDLDVAVSLSEFSERASAVSPPESNALVLAVKDADPQTATRYAEAWAREYLQFRQEQAGSAVDEAVQRINASIELAQAAFGDAVVAESLAEPGSLDAQNAAAARRLAEEQLSGLVGQRTSLETTSVYPGQILSAPQVPTEPEGFKSISIALAGAILGALLGLGVGIATAGPPRVVRSVERLPGDLKPLVEADLANTDRTRNAAELAALVERVRRVPGADVEGVLVVSVPGEPSSRLNDALCAELVARGVDVDQVKDPAARSARTHTSRPSVVLLSCERRDPWVRVLSSSADIVLAVAVVDETPVDDARVTCADVAKSNGPAPGLVIVNGTVRPATSAAAPAVRPAPSAEASGGSTPTGQPGRVEQAVRR